MAKIKPEHRISPENNPNLRLDNFNEAATFMQDFAAVNMLSLFTKPGEQESPELLALKNKLREKVKSLGGIKEADAWIKADAPEVISLLDINPKETIWLID